MTSLEALSRIKESYDAYYFMNKYGDDGTHKEEFAVLSPLMVSDLDKSALAWIKDCYDCYYKDELENHPNAFDHLEFQLSHNKIYEVLTDESSKE